MGFYKNTNGVLTPIAGRGRAEYGASTVRSGYLNAENLTEQSSGVMVLDLKHPSVQYAITFSTPMPDNDYIVICDVHNTNLQVEVASTNKTKNGFTVTVRNLVATMRADRGETTDGFTYGLIDNYFNYTAFKLYTDTEYNSVLALEDRVSELETQLEELVLGGVIEADTLPAVPDNYIYNVKNTTTIGALFKDILAYGSTSSGNEYIRNLSKYYISGNANVWQDNDEWGTRISGTLIFDVPITVPEMVAEGYTFPAGNVSKINIRDGEWNSGGYNGCAFVYTDGSVVGSTDKFGLNATFSKRTDQIIINVPKVYSKGTQLVTMQEFNIFKNTIA